MVFENLTDKLIIRENDSLIMRYPQLNDFNKYLEKFYNKYGEEEIKYVKHFWFYDDVKDKIKPTDFQ
jgi:chromosome condensin MukBEF MukE localization factor